jgi:hypothetical protein
MFGFIQPPVNRIKISKLVYDKMRAIIRVLLESLIADFNDGTNVVNGLAPANRLLGPNVRKYIYSRMCKCSASQVDGILKYANANAILEMIIRMAKTKMVDRDRLILYPSDISEAAIDVSRLLVRNDKFSYPAVPYLCLGHGRKPWTTHEEMEGIPPGDIV